MQDEKLLMMPGPVPMPQRVRLAMSRQAINHRGKEFGECLEYNIEHNIIYAVYSFRGR